ncbi:hypothetical protein [uncultured Cytophaga sp.]|nr:hypothetical protein [uncultured Cytophaga sp.]
MKRITKKLKELTGAIQKPVTQKEKEVVIHTASDMGIGLRVVRFKAAQM